MNREQHMSNIGEFDILDWIESGTVAQRSVVIYNDPALVAEFEALQRALNIAEREEGDEQSMGEAGRVADLSERLRELWERWEASKATWVVRALASERIDEIVAEYPAPAEGEGIAEVVEARNLALISDSVVRVETSRGTATAVSVEALRKMRSAPHGRERIAQLVAAVNAATRGDTEIPAPKSPSSSKGTPA